MSLRSSLLLFLLSIDAYCASCCGGGANTPIIITGDHTAQFSSTLSTSQVIGDVSPEGRVVFRSSQNKETSQTLRLDASRTLGQYFQVGLTIPVIGRSRTLQNQNKQSEWGLGDVSLTGVWEFLPERFYSAWKPRGFLYARSTFPTAPSIYNSKDTLMVSARGQGFYQQSLGTAFFKRWETWDVNSVFEISASLPRKFDSKTTGPFKAAGALSGLVSVAGGYSFGDYRFGLALAPEYQGGREVVTQSTGNRSHTLSRLVWNTTASLNYLHDMSWMVQLTYNDQTLFGPARNTLLERTFALMLQKRFE